MKHAKIPKMVVSLLPPAVATFQDQKYAIFEGNWYEVDEKFTIKDALKHWKRWESANQAQSSKIVEDRVWKVANSKKNGHYVVKYANKSWSCSCPGYGFRRACRHIDEIKVKLN